MGNFNNSVSQSGFSASSMPERKYYNLYTEAKGIKGDATNADGTAGFYGDYKVFVSSSSPWFSRGGYSNNGILAGVFYFYFSDGFGSTSTAGGSRLVLSVW